MRNFNLKSLFLRAHIFPFKIHTEYMRLSCIICSAILITLGICGDGYALTGFDMLAFICFDNLTAVRSVEAAGGVCALFLAYALAVLRPYKGLK